MSPSHDAGETGFGFRSDRRFTKFRQTAETGLKERVNALLLAPVGRREWPLGFYSKELLLSVPARMGFVQPDRAPLP